LELKRSDREKNYFTTLEGWQVDLEELIVLVEPWGLGEPQWVWATPRGKGKL